MSGDVTEQSAGAKLDTFGPVNDDVEHDWSTWRTIKDPGSEAIDQRVCMSCGRHEFRYPDTEMEQTEADHSG